MKHRLLYLWNLYPPFLGAGIRITKIAPDLSSVEVKLKLRWWNRNYIGTMFGGSIYSMCDPFHMVILIEQLGPDYIVRDKGAEIRFLKKGTNTATALFAVDPQTIALIWNHPEDVQERHFLALVKDNSGDVIAEVRKTLHIRRKSAAPK